MHKIGCVVPINGRSPLTRKTIKRLFRQKNCEMNIVCVGSSEEDRKEVDGTGASFLMYRNNPLGAKWQFGIDTLMNSATQLDAYMHTGSDDWLSDYYCESAMDMIKADPEIGMVGVNNMYFYKYETKNLLNWSYPAARASEPMGCGRLIPKETMDMLSWSIMDTAIESGLDNKMHKMILEKKKVVFLPDEKGCALSVKTDLWDAKNKFEIFSTTGSVIRPVVADCFFKDYFPEILSLELT